MAAETFESVAPATGEVLGSFRRSSAADVDRAVAKAKAAFDEWRLVPAPERGDILFRFAELLRAHKADLTDLMTREMGKVKAEAGGDVQEAIDMTYYMAGEGRRMWGQTTPSGTPASPSNRTKPSARSGVSSAGLRTTVLPQTSAGVSFHAGIAIGKFHGVIAPTTPTGMRTLIMNLSRSSLGVVCPKSRRPSPPM